MQGYCNIICIQSLIIVQLEILMESTVCLHIKRVNHVILGVVNIKCMR